MSIPTDIYQSVRGVTTHIAPLNPESDIAPNTEFVHMVVFSNPGCMPCKRSKTEIAKHAAIPALEVQVQDTPWAKPLLVDTLGATASPVVMLINAPHPGMEPDEAADINAVDHKHYWQGLIPENIKAAAMRVNDAFAELTPEQVARLEEAVEYAKGQDTADELTAFYEYLANN